MQKSFTVIGLAFVMTAIYAQGSGFKNAKVSFRVVDECNIPVTNAYIFACSLSNHKGEGYTDSSGVFTYEARAVYQEMNCQVRKKGYYQTEGTAWQASKWDDVPTNTLTVVMKRIINPVPMVKHKVELLFPVLNEPVGFDLEIGDWIEPYGRGKIEDISITGTRNCTNTTFRDLRACFVAANAYDGFVEFPVVRETDRIKNTSDLKPPQLAPEAGYTNRINAYDFYSLDTTAYRSTSGQSARDNKDYLFLVRSRTNQLGKLLYANVGWFSDSIKLSPSYGNETGISKSLKTNLPAALSNSMLIQFEYYFNPNPLSRSLEPKEIADRQGRRFPIVDPHPKSNVVQSVETVEKRVVTGAIADALGEQVRQFMLCMREGDTNKCATILADDFRTVSGMDRARQLKGLSGRVAAMRENKVQWEDTRVDAVYATEKDNEFLVVVDVVMTRPGEKNVSRQTWTFRNQNKQWFLVLIDR